MEESQIIILPYIVTLLHVDLNGLKSYLVEKNVHT